MKTQPLFLFIILFCPLVSFGQCDLAFGGEKTSPPGPMPRPLNLYEFDEELDYPQLAREYGIEGTLLINVLVDDEGHYVDHRFLNKVHSSFHREVNQEISRLHFVPAELEGRPVAGYMTLPVRFRLKQ